jgi:gliding motility-associated-like protein
MKRFLLTYFFGCIATVTTLASHITGGEMYYTYLGFGNGLHTYSVTLKLYQRCNSGRQFPNPAIISIFDRTANTRVRDINVQISNTDNIGITNPDPCISNPPTVCYDVAYYTFTVALPASDNGYVLASQVNYRIAGITNLTPGYGNVGALYSAEIPGTATLADGAANHSANFVGSDLVVICADNNFSYSFAAVDADNDELRYSFCGAYASTDVSTGGGAIPTGPPPFPQVPYDNPQFNSLAPLGTGVTVNASTGEITGIAPSAGIYVVTVCVDEIRGGVVIARQRKDIQINVASCSIAAASLLPEYLLCGSSQTLNAANQSTSPLITTTNWEIYDFNNNLIYSSADQFASYTFPDTGLYKLKLIINRNEQCNDSTESLVRVYPGFVPEFSSAGICITKPTRFTDQTTSVYGRPNSWNWDFGEVTAFNDVSTQQHPVYTYPSMGTKDIRLIVTDTKGCRDTLIKSITIIDKPPITLNFRDTLICINDNLQLQASGSGVFSWSPLVNITNPNTATPTVSPPVTTTYYVDIDDNGCKNRDSVRVRVVNFVTLQAMPDTLICRSDTIQLRVNSDGLQYLWSPSPQVLDPTAKNPRVVTNSPQTTYNVTAIIGGCSATDNIVVTTVPYPVVNAGADFSICYNALAQLSGSTDGSSWQWSPARLLNNPAILNPVSYPPRTTDYVLTAFDTKGCPKPSRDTVKVTVYPKMNVSAGRDTAVITGQPLQLLATGGETYTWSPASFLSGALLANPVAVFNDPSPGIRIKVVAQSNEGCFDSAFVNIKVYKTPPTVFVPTAFTPNNDGKNDLLRPLGAGILNIDYFLVYNRWGQLVFSTNQNGVGWDGRIGGNQQASGTFVWVVKAVDYLGQPYLQKGTVTLIR